jgi:hypothetical protein
VRIDAALAEAQRTGGTLNAEYRVVHQRATAMPARHTGSRSKAQLCAIPRTTREITWCRPRYHWSEAGRPDAAERNSQA